jgi:septum site-determining protein MinD
MMVSPALVSENNEVATASRSIAIVSGKGGSGKTIIASVLVEVFDTAGRSVVLVDADTGTAGLTFYFGLSLVTNTSVGLSNFFFEEDPSKGGRLLQSLRPVKGLNKTSFLSVGDHRRFPRDLPEELLTSKFKDLVRILKGKADYVIFDCRGGLDDESLAACRAVDDIILIVESDATSYQASQQLVETLSQSGVSQKLKGFMINKVFDDPSVVARNGTAVFRSQYLTAIPFDFEAMRAFFVGEVPGLTSGFGVHVQHGLQKAYTGIPEPHGRVYRFDEYKEIGFVNLDSLRGGIIVSLFIVTFALLAVWQWFRREQYLVLHLPLTFTLVTVILAGLGLLGSISNTRQAIGSFVNRLLSATLLLQKR